MRIEIAEAVLLDAHHELSLQELAALSGLALARTACRLRRDFDLDAGGLALALRLLERIRGLEAQLEALRARMPHRYR